MRASLLIAAIILIPVIAHAQDAQNVSTTTGVPDLNMVTNDPGTHGLPCADDGSEGTLKSIIEAPPSTLRILHFDSMTQTGVTVSGNQMCEAKLFTSLGPVTVQYEWFNHAGSDYMASIYTPPSADVPADQTAGQ